MFITVSNEVAARLCFYTCLSVILFTGGVSARHPHPLGRHPPGQTPPLPTTATAADCTRPTGMLSCLHISY